MNISTKPVQMTERDLKILQAMISNLSAFINDANRKAISLPEDQRIDVEVTCIAEKF